jgi:hypothetical protein
MPHIATEHNSAMKIYALLSCLIFPVALSTLVSCEDHREGVEPTRFRLKKSVATSAYRANTKDTSTTVYNYDAKGYLNEQSNVSTNTFGNTRIVTNTRFTYDAQNRLAQIEEKYIAGSTTVNRIDYTYDSAGNVLVEIKSSAFGPNRDQSGNFEVTGKTEFTYDGSQLPATVATMYGKSSFSYANGNIYQSVFTSSDPKQSPITTTYQYDNKPNPFYGVTRGYGFQQQQLNRNNQVATSSTPANGPKQTLTYNADGLLSKLNLTYIPNPPYNFDRQIVYEYEAY